MRLRSKATKPPRPHKQQEDPVVSSHEDESLSNAPGGGYDLLVNPTNSSTLAVRRLDRDDGRAARVRRAAAPFTVATTTANEVCAAIHDRMPVILQEADWSRWLGEEGGEAPPLDLLKPFPAEMMEAIPIGAAVGNVKNEGSLLIEPLALNSA